MRLFISAVLAGLIVSCVGTGARAQSNLLVVSTCGTLPLAYLPGAVRTGTQDVNGRACGAASIVGAGDATAANQVLQITQETAINTILGTQAGATCASDTGTCTIAALAKRNNERLTSILAALSSVAVTGPLTDVQLRATPVPVSGTVAVTGIATAANQTTEITALGTINTTLGTPMQATGGTVGLVAGSAIVGNIRIDQTTPGTTNGVQVNAALPAGANVIGQVTANAGTNLNTSALALEAGNLATLAGVVGSKAPGTAAATAGLAGAVYSSTTPTLTNGQQAALQSDTSGAVYVNTTGRKDTYGATATVVPAAGGADIFTLTGSASKTIRVRQVKIGGIATAASATIINVLKRSGAATGGVSTAVTAVPYDSNNAAASGTVLNYSTNPTPGTLVGVIDQQYITLTTAAGAIPLVPLLFTFSGRGAQSVVLRGTGDVLAVNFNAATIAGASLTVSIEWTEE